VWGDSGTLLNIICWLSIKPALIDGENGIGPKQKPQCRVTLHCATARARIKHQCAASGTQFSKRNPPEEPGWNQPTMKRPTIHHTLA